MITTQKINVWIQDPAHLQEVETNKLQQLAKEFPYFSIGQIFIALKEKKALTDALNMHNWHPVLSAVLQAKASDTYRKLVHAELKDDKQHQVNPDDITPELRAMDEHLDALIQQNVNVPDYFSKKEMEAIVDQSSIVEDNTNAMHEENAVLVVMSYAEWLKFLTKKSIHQKEEEESKSALKALWQKEKLALALEEETDEIPEDVFEMAVNSISKNEEMASESLAEVYIRQNKKQQAINMYKKLSLLYPEKNTYFAMKIEKLQKEL